MTKIVVCYWPHAGFGETCNKFSCSKSPRIPKLKKQKNHPKKYTPSSSIKHVPSNNSDFRPNFLLSTISMIVSSVKTKQYGF